MPAGKILVARRGQFVGRRQIDPELEGGRRGLEGGIERFFARGERHDDDRAPHFAKPYRERARRGRLRPDQARAKLIGRPLGSAAFVAAIERSLGRSVAPGKRGRKPRDEGAAGENIRGKTGAAPKGFPRLNELTAPCFD